MDSTLQQLLATMFSQDQELALARAKIAELEPRSLLLDAAQARIRELEEAVVPDAN